MFILISSSILIATSLGLVSAQSLTSGCTSTLTGLVSDSEVSACLNPSGLVPLFLNSGNASIIQPIDNYLKGVCSSPSCSNATLEKVTRSVLSGCGTELATIGVQTNDTDRAVALVQQYYPTVRKIACLKDGDTLCVTQTLTNIQNSVGQQLSINNIVSLIGNGGVQLPSNVSCTNCIKEAYNIIKTDQPNLVANAQEPLQSTCGASFVDGSTPSGISQGASVAGASTTNNSNNAAGLSHGVLTGLSVSILATISTFFVILL